MKPLFTTEHVLPRTLGETRLLSDRVPQFDGPRENLLRDLDLKRFFRSCEMRLKLTGVILKPASASFRLAPCLSLIPALDRGHAYSLWPRAKLFSKYAWRRDKRAPMKTLDIGVGGRQFRRARLRTSNT